MRLKRWMLFFGDVVLIVAATKFAQWIRFGRYYDIFEAETGASFFTFILILVLLYVFDLYNFRRIRSSLRMVGRVAMAVGWAALVLMILFYALPQWQFGRGIFLIQTSIACLFFVAWRCFFSHFFIQHLDKLPVLVVGAGKAGIDLGRFLARHASPYRMIGFLDDKIEAGIPGKDLPPVLGGTDRLMEVATDQDVKTLIWALPRERSGKLINKLVQARLNGLEVIDAPAIYETLAGLIPVEHIHDSWLLFSDGFNLLSKAYIKRIKRMIDFWVSLFLLLVTSPLILVTALAIRLESPGPVIFRQKREGLNGDIYEIEKFRSMVVGAEANGPQWAQAGDPRVTRVGRVIRKLRIDELPQLFNVLRGEMSLIGPRPERPEFVAILEKDIPYFHVRNHVRPGITGWAQVNYTYGASVEDSLRKLEYDLYYIKNMSLLLDLRIILKTIGVVLFGQGAR